MVVQAWTSKAIRTANTDDNCQAHDGHKSWFKFYSASSLKLSEAKNGAKLLQVKMRVMQFNAF